MQTKNLPAIGKAMPRMCSLNVKCRHMNRYAANVIVHQTEIISLVSSGRYCEQFKSSPSVILKPSFVPLPQAAQAQDVNKLFNSDIVT